MGRTVQARPGVAVLWGDVPGLSSFVQHHLWPGVALPGSSWVRQRPGVLVSVVGVIAATVLYPQSYLTGLGPADLRPDPTPVA